MSKRVLGAASLAVTLSLALSSCGLIRDLTSGEDDDAPEEADEVEAVEQELPFLRQSRMFVEDGNDVAFEVSIEALEYDGEYVMLEYTHNVLEDMPGEVTMATAPIRMIDPISGEILRAMEHEDHEEVAYGTYFNEGDPYMPTHEGLATTYRNYFPAPSEDVDKLTFTGRGIGHVPSVPMEYVDEFTEIPEPNAYDYIDPETWAQEELPDEIWYPEDPPPPGLETDEYVHSMESFVDSPTASTTRAGDEEIIALHADNMFEFDEAEPTTEAAETIQETAQSLRENLGEDIEITVIGHTDGEGSDDYNQDLSEERAEAAAELLEEELGSDVTLVTEGRGSTELVAEEGEDDDEEARARNRRVEFSYEVPMAETDSDEGETGLDAAKRHVEDPAEYFDFDDMDVFTTATHDDIDLNVYPLVRDGAYLFQMVGFQNPTLSDLEADLDGDEAALPGSPEQYTEGSMGGFRLEEPDGGLLRYVIRIRDFEDEYEDFADEIHTLVPGEEYLALSVFPAPAPEVEELTLYAGAFGEIRGVPIQ